MVTIYSVIFNEELMLPFMIRFYRKRFPDCKFVIYDNRSTDNSVKIAKELGCLVVDYDTGGEFDDAKLLEVKNNCWKNSPTDWVGVCDCDELVDINEGQLKREGDLGSTIISTEGYTIINIENNLDIAGMRYGLRAEDKSLNPPFHPYDKSVFFNKSAISEINYSMGCHSCSPVGRVKRSDEKYKLYHFKYVNPDLMAKRYRAITLSEENKRQRLSFQFEFGESTIRDIFSSFRSQSTKIIEHEIF